MNSKLKEKNNRRKAVMNKVQLPSLGDKSPKKVVKKARVKTPQKPVAADDHSIRGSLKKVLSPNDAQNIKEIRELMTVAPYASMLTKALAPKGTPQKVYETLLNDATFKKYPSYHNKVKAKYYADELAGLGILQLLLDESKKPGHERITDIGFNSNNFLTIETNENKFTFGNHPGEPRIDRRYMKNIIERLSQKEGANGTAWTENAPLFNGSNKENYLRISANHDAIAPDGMTASIRVASPYIALTKKNFDKWAPRKKHLDTYNLFRILVECHANIMISAETGAGKTELQKMLVGFIPFEDRIVMIEDVAETHLPTLYPDKDIMSWVTKESENPRHSITITKLVKQALRNNPKWLIVAETRGEEAYEMFQGVKSDHSIITTLHSISNEAVPSRFIGMAKMGYEINEESTERDFLRYMDIGVHITKKIINGHVIRYADEIAEFVPISKEHPNGINVLLSQHITKQGVREYWSGSPSPLLQQKLYNERDKELTQDEWRTIPKKNKIREKIYDFS